MATAKRRQYYKQTPLVVEVKLTMDEDEAEKLLVTLSHVAGNADVQSLFYALRKILPIQKSRKYYATGVMRVDDMKEPGSGAVEGSVSQCSPSGLD